MGNNYAINHIFLRNAKKDTFLKIMYLCPVKKSYFILLVLVLLLLAPTLADAQGCAMCKSAVESSMGQKNSVAAGINKGILYLMAVPYLLLMFIFRKQLVALWRSWRGKEVETED